MSSIAFHLGIKADTLRRQYKKYESGFENWDQASHAQEYLTFPKNLSKYLAIDEVVLSKGELYTILSARDKKGRKGKMIACVASTKAEEIIKVLERLPLKERMRVKEVTLDMASAMIKATSMCFPNATLVADRFHLIRLINEVVQQVRIDQRWMQIDQDNQDILQAKKKGERHLPKVLSNGDTLRKLLARSRYLLYKLPHQWTLNQQRRALLLFQRYPKIKQAYDHLLSFKKIFQLVELDQATQALESWIRQATHSGIDYLVSASASIIEHKQRILAFFHNRATNAHAESLNAQIKLFRANLRGVKDTNFFLFRLSKIFA